MTNNRKAGILLHITSLPGKFGIGDLGPEAYRFADFLEKSKQTYWQILPITQTDGGCAYSPYSSLSAFAGNTLLISPELLYQQGLISQIPHKLSNARKTSRIDYNVVDKQKKNMLNEAYARFSEGHFPDLRIEFERFCKAEKYWLDDYALFMTIRKLHDNKPWINWPEEYKIREQKTIESLLVEQKAQIENRKFAQFLFLRQWLALRNYCNDKGIQIYGDIPIYTGYNSVDVWAHRSFFKLNENGSLIAVAGCPPDYFNDEGQWWGMPVYNWEHLRNNGYGWWIDRMRKNIQLFDITRLDHFRGFSAYWEIPSQSETAREGYWVKGPAYELFDTLYREFPQMRLIAEDLGEIDQPVYDLRNHYKLMGMRVLLFSFGDDMPHTLHIPHRYTSNSVVYTGTHDNNTIRGWYENELGKHFRKNIESYTGIKIKTRNCHKAIIRLAYQSVANLAIIPMQDILGLGEEARMNIPSVVEGNWLWRVESDQLTAKVAEELSKMVVTYGRE
jgi:4-alpha-glucanotransferase